MSKKSSNDIYMEQMEEIKRMLALPSHLQPFPHGAPPMIDQEKTSTNPEAKPLDLQQLDNVSEQPLEVLIGVAALQAAERAITVDGALNSQILNEVRRYNSAVRACLIANLMGRFFPGVGNNHLMTEVAKLVDDFLVKASLTKDELEKACHELTTTIKKQKDKLSLGEALRGLQKQLMSEPDPQRVNEWLKLIRQTSTY